MRIRPILPFLACIVIASIATTWAVSAPPAADENKRRVNHTGRVLGTMPKIDHPLLFNTPEADAVLVAIQIFPTDSPWNEDISHQPVHRDSARMIQQIGASTGLRFNLDMAFAIVPAAQPKVNVKLTKYANESDAGPYPVPDNAPIENWPLAGGALETIQKEGGGDRHLLVVDPLNQKLHEFWEARKTPAGWEASCEATFDLSSNALRPSGWTSSDAAGLPIFPAVVRYDECERGIVEHAMRFTVRRTRREFIYPATHQAGKGNDPAVPAMGQRFRLKRDADLAGLSPHALAIAKGLQTYGMFVADNGGDWRLSIAPDPRLKGLNDLQRFKGADFEVVETTGPNEGPRRR